MTLRRKIGFSLLLVSLTMFLAGCTTNWVAQAVQIVQALLPVILGIIGFALSFGANLPANTIDALNKWKDEATNDLGLLKSMLDQYNAADPATKTTLLGKIETGLNVVKANAQQALGAFHIDNPAVQNKVEAVIDLVLSEVASVIAMLPAFNVLVKDGPQAAHDYMVRNDIAEPLSAKKLKQEYNRIMSIPTADPVVNAEAAKYLLKV